MPHLRRQGFQQVSNPLLVFDIDFKVTHEHQATVCPYAFPAPAEFPGLHVALHDVDAILLIEGDAGDFVEADDIVLGPTRPRWPVALLTNMRATVALPPEIRWEAGDIC